MKDSRARVLGFGALVAFVIVTYFMGEAGSPLDVKRRMVRLARDTPETAELCETCHAGPHPGKIQAAHPAEMGCVNCHGGKPGEVTMRAHGPADAASRACVRCHGERVYSTDDSLRGEAVRITAETTRGRMLNADLRCGACHDDAALPDEKMATPLADVDSKLRPEWLVAWLESPRALAPHGEMPNAWPVPRDSQTGAPVTGDALAAFHARRDSEVVAIVAALYAQAARARKKPDARGHDDDIQNRANVVGASADEGARLYAALACGVCHAADDAPRAAGERERGPSLADEGRRTSEDFLAYYLADPSRYDAHGRMPSLRLDAREAASLAKYLVTLKKDAPLAPPDVARAVTEPLASTERVQCNVGAPSEMTRADCGQLLLGKYGCAQCHALAGGASARVTAKAPRGTMPDYGLSVADAKAIDAWVTARGLPPPARAFEVTPDDDAVIASHGEDLFRQLSCGACHRLGEAEPPIAHELSDSRRARMTPPSLAEEGSRARPEWLFSFLLRPGALGVRPVFHPEWVWGKLPPLEAVGPRMPSYGLRADDATALVRWFTRTAGASYPYTDARPRAHSPEERVVAFELLNRGDEKQRCTGCHYTGDVPADRVKDDAALVAPSLSLVARRRRPDWVAKFLPTHDPKSQPLSDAKAELVTDVIFSLGERQRLPRAGEESGALQP